MTTRKKTEPPPPPPDVRDLTDSIRAASLESTEQIEESRRLSKDSGNRIAAAVPPVDADPEQGCDRIPRRPHPRPENPRSDVSGALAVAVSTGPRV